MKKIVAFLILLVSLLFTAFVIFPEGEVYTSVSGTAKFTSKAPIETIIAESKKLSGALDAEKRTFAFTIPISSFEGFESPLQKEHFNENYMESDKIPKAIYKGKIIEEVNIGLPGTYIVRVKGMMQIHNVEKEIIIKSKIITAKSGQIKIESSFNILLKDFNINIPALVSPKIAQEILVEVNIAMNSKK